MITVPYIALQKFENEEIQIVAPDARDRLVEPKTYTALSMLSDPYALDNGSGPDSTNVSWVVMVQASKFDGKYPPVGSRILKTDTHPELFINSVHLNGEALWMNCTAQKGAA